MNNNNKNLYNNKIVRPAPRGGEADPEGVGVRPKEMRLLILLNNKMY